MNETMKRLPRAVFALNPERRDREGRVTQREGDGNWKEVGVAWTNIDESINVILDAIPVSGKLQIREKRVKKDGPEATVQEGVR